MIEFDPLYDDLKVIRNIRNVCLTNMAAGITITKFSSEGTTFEGDGIDTMELFNATTRYLDLYNDNIITETAPNFSSRN